MYLPNKNVIFLGNSGSGKSTACSYLEIRFEYKNVHPLAFYKRFLEDHYGLSKGSLDDPDTKKITPTGATKTLGEILVDSFDFWKERDRYFTTRRLVKDLTHYWNNGEKVCLQAIRNIPEAAGIIEVVKDLDEKYVVIYLRGRGEEKVSDRYLQDIDAMFSTSDQCIKRVEFDNSKEDKQSFETFLYQTLQ